MSALEDFRDHARCLSESAHRDDCDRIHRIVKRSQWLEDRCLDGTLSCPSESGHGPHSWVGNHGMDWACPGLCGGCSSDADRALWTRLADEIDEHLSAGGDEPLWETDDRTNRGGSDASE